MMRIIGLSSRSLPNPVGMAEMDTAAPADVQGQISYQAEVWRKAIHLLALIVPFLMALLGKAWSLYLLIPITTLALAGDVLRVRSAGVARFIERFFGFMMRGNEVPPIGGPVTINGATWVFLSATCLALVFPIAIAVPAFVMFMLSDAAAALVGRRYGRTPWGRSRRTVEGSLAFLLTGLIIIALFARFSDLVFWVGAASVVAAALAEIPSGPFNDNLRVPMVAATVLFVLDRFVLGLDLALFFG